MYVLKIKHGEITKHILQNRYIFFFIKNIIAEWNLLLLIDVDVFNIVSVPI